MPEDEREGSGRPAAAQVQPAVVAAHGIDPAVTRALVEGLRGYAALLGAGGWPGRHDGGSLRLLALSVTTALADLLDGAARAAATGVSRCQAPLPRASAARVTDQVARVRHALLGTGGPAGRPRVPARSGATVGLRPPGQAVRRCGGLRPR